MQRTAFRSNIGFAHVSAHHTTYWYHPDHLGSASWVSDKAGKGIQHLYYLPWGEELANQRGTAYESRYTFSGKERDEETGYSYFGARHYNSDLSLWLSVDPMSDKYPGVSPYVYCGNNPVRLVDPDGKDIYEFDNYGNYIQSTPCKEYDRICVINIDTKEVTYSQQYDYGTIFQLETDIRVNIKNPDLQSANLFQVNSVESAKSIFEFIVSKSNVEWGVVYDAGDNDGFCTNFIGTNRAEHANTISSIIDNRGFSLNGDVVHSHPSGCGIPGKKDVLHAVELGKKHPSAQFKTYTPPDEYKPYGTYTPYNGESQYAVGAGQELERLNNFEK